MVAVAILVIWIIARFAARMYHRPGWISNPTYSIQLIPHFFSTEECDRMMSIARTSTFHASKVVTSSSLFGSLNQDTRRSEQVWLSDGNDPLIRKLSERVAALTQTRLNQQESWQVVRYQPGGEFKPHYDAFSQGVPFWKTNRMWTLLIYLHVPEEGGETEFPLIAESIRPVKGLAILFQSVEPSLNCIIKESKHAGRPVRKGEKWIANKWISV